MHPSTAPVPLSAPFDLSYPLDIVEGNLKSIMRLVLALAAHFKPGSSRTVSQGRDSKAPVQSHQPHCATAVAQGAAAALAEVDAQETAATESFKQEGGRLKAGIADAERRSEEY